MAYLALYLAVTVAGYFIGSALSKRGIVPRFVGKLQTLVIMILVFLMGSRIGANDDIVASLSTIGLVSLVYTLIILAVTTAAFTVARRLMGFDRYGVCHRGADSGGLRRKKAGSTSAGPAEHEENGSTEAVPKRVNSLTIIIVAFVALGILAGYFVLPDAFMNISGHLLTLTLCLLLVLIGMDIGMEGTIAQNFRQAGWRVLLFPFINMGAMVAGSVIASLFLPMSAQDSLCIGAGFAWYSLAPAMLAEYSMRVSAISFMHNVFREIIGILLTPVVARRIGYIECYCLCGSPSMDVCLPVIERATNGDVAVYSFINGAILSASVPILVSIFMSI